MPSSSIYALQLGKSWFPEQAGSGLDRMFYGLCKHLPASGVDVRGLVAGSPVLTGAPSSIQSFAPPSSSLLTRFSALRREVRAALDAHSFDLVASHFALYTAPALDHIRSLPHVIHFHGPWAGESAAEGEKQLAVYVKRMLERFVYRRGTRFIVLSHAFKQILASDYQIPHSAIDIVPGGVDIDRFATSVTPAEARERLSWPTDRPILLTVRRLAHRMGLDTLVEAMTAIVERVPDALLLIAGSGPLHSELNRRITAHDLEHHVQLLGFVPDEDLPFAYSAADVSVVPTRSLEGFGLTTIESLAAGTPVFVTPRGGLPEVVRDLDPALILEDSSAASLASRLGDALTGRLSLPSPAACRAYARDRYAWPVIAAQTRHVYEDLIS
jgi:glycosyltransferase involved in cell wall biosynthesis